MIRAFETIHGSREVLSCHRHRSAFLALVLEGEYEERSVDGRYVLGPGCLVLHPPFHAHTNHFLSERVRVLNLDLPDVDVGSSAYCAGTAAEVDEVVSLMWQAPGKVARVLDQLFDARLHREHLKGRWMDRFSEQLSLVEGGFNIQSLASETGVSSAHASRAFVREFGHSPVSFRREMQLRKALSALANGLELAAVAIEAGFADQSHMGRAFKAAFGRTPRHLQTELVGVRQQV